MKARSGPGQGRRHLALSARLSPQLHERADFSEAARHAAMLAGHVPIFSTFSAEARRAARDEMAFDDAVPVISTRAAFTRSDFLTIKHFCMRHI